MSDYLNLEPKGGSAMTAGCVDVTWHLVSPDTALRTTGDVSPQAGARISGVATRDRIVTAGLTFPGTPAWSPPT